MDRRIHLAALTMSGGTVYSMGFKVELSDCRHCGRQVVRESSSSTWWHLNIAAPHLKKGVSCRSAVPYNSPDWGDREQWKRKTAAPDKHHKRLMTAGEVQVCVDYMNERVGEEVPGMILSTQDAFWHLRRVLGTSDKYR